MAIQVSKMIINNKYNVFKILDINDMVSLEKYINMYSTVAKDTNKNFITNQQNLLFNKSILLCKYTFTLFRKKCGKKHFLEKSVAKKLL